MKKLLEEFRKLPDYRKNKVRYTNPSELLFLSLLSVMSGANGFSDMSLWMKARKREISKLLERPFKAPAYTTIRNAFLGMDIKAVEQLQREWVEGLNENSEGLTIVASDGKTMRGSKNNEMNEKARHIVSLFLTDSKLTLTQNEVNKKSNEIPALIELLDNLKLKNCVITMDAMHPKGISSLSLTAHTQKKR